MKTNTGRSILFHFNLGTRVREKANLLLLCLSFLIPLAGHGACQGPIQPPWIDSTILKIAGEKKDTVKINLLLELVSYYLKSDPRRAEAYIVKALSLSEENKYHFGLANSYYFLSLLFNDYDPDLSEQLISKSLDFANQTGDNKLIAKVTNMVGVLQARSNFNQSLNSFKQAIILELKNNTRIDSALSVYINNVGTIYFQEGKYILARQYFLKAKETAEKANSRRNMLYPMMNIGRCYIEEKQYAKGYEYYKQCLSQTKKFINSRMMPELNNIISEYFLKVGNKDSATFYAHKAIESSDISMNISEKRLALMSLYGIYKNSGQFEPALKYFEMAQAVQDTINKKNENHHKELLNIKIRYQKDLETNVVKLQRQKILIYSFAIITLFVLIAAYFIWSIQKLKAKQKQLTIDGLILKNANLEQEITYKSQELTSNFLRLAQRNDLLYKIITQLEGLLKYDPLVLPEKIGEIIKELKFNLHSDIWELFEKEFIGIHPGFYDKLIQSFPDLTQKEKRLCALIRLNLNSKEIAQITGLNIESIGKARTRLRKKFNITNQETSLTSFLFQF